VRLRRVSFSTGGAPVAEAVKAFAQDRALTHRDRNVHHQGTTNTEGRPAHRRPVSPHDSGHNVGTAVAERVRVSRSAVRSTPTNKLDFQGSPDLDRRPRSPVRIPRCELKKSSSETHNPMPTRLISIQVMKRSKG
jgi:hypothetical protein